MEEGKVEKEFLASLRSKEWEKVETTLVESDDESTLASFVEAETGMTALHLAAKVAASHQSPNQAVINVIARLARANPSALVRKCRTRGWTPLCYAVGAPDLVAAAQRTEDAATTALLLQDQATTICDILLRASRESIMIRGFNGHSPLSLFVICVSRAMSRHGAKPSFFLRPNQDMDNNTTDDDGNALLPKMELLETLVLGSSLEMLESALATLHSSNTVAIMGMLSHADASARRDIQRLGRQITTPRVFQHVGARWVWDWALAMLRGIHDKKTTISAGSSNASTGGSSSFHALHVASSITNFPTAFLMLAMRACPAEVRAPLHDGKLPVQAVAGWTIGEGGSGCRKHMCYTSLKSEYPAALESTDKEEVGATAVQHNCE